MTKNPTTPRPHRSLSLCLLLVLFAGCGAPSSGADQIDPALRTRCVDTMRQTLQNESRWAKVHAAEFLIGLDYRDGVREVFTNELEAHGDEPQYRIGIWRVLAQLDRHDDAQYGSWIEKIEGAFLDVDGPDRVHAAEALAKLGYRFPLPETVSDRHSDDVRSALLEFAEEGPSNGRAFAWWVLLNNGPPEVESRIAGLLRSPDISRTAAYALRHQDRITAASLAALRAAFQDVSPESPARVYLLTAILKHLPAESEQRAALQSELLNYLAHGEPEQRYEASRLLADMGDEFTDQLVAVLNQPDTSSDVKSGVAHALCRIGRRYTQRMGLADWMVVLFYGVVMLSIGWYYAQRSRTAEDYLLGGRTMSSWTVGLSLFATLLSTLSYLAWPGEMIKHGPIVLMGAAAYPFVFLVVGWLVIPRIRQLHVISAYEILEKRFGLSIRLLGSFLFLSLRLLWMASIIYWTTAIVLLPAAGLDASYVPRFALLLGIVTIVYTSMGGLRAVVLTDVIQTFILLAGAVTALLLITHSLGGVSQWFPDRWAPHWTKPRIWFDFTPGARATVANAMLSVFAWHVCTSGSDQMAIQRYMATPDVKTARRTLAVSLSTDFVVLVFLGLLGLALLAFFSSHPDRLPDGQTIYGNADKLFPRFVVVGLPLGFSGLVIAGLLAAAMSSLSSGVNSSSAVISQDLVQQLWKAGRSDAQQVRLARISAVCVGVVAVLLSTAIGSIQGNMLEVVYKVVNLFVAPLFFLFFMAIFVSWATTLGTWIGEIAAIVTAVVIAFWGDATGSNGLSFLWIMPGSLTVGIVVGCVCSFVHRVARQKGKRINPE